MTSGEVLEHVRSQIARYKVPDEVIFVDALPRTATGKIRKNELAIIDLGERPSPAPWSGTPRGSTAPRAPHLTPWLPAPRHLGRKGALP